MRLLRTNLKIVLVHKTPHLIEKHLTITKNNVMKTLYPLNMCESALPNRSSFLKIRSRGLMPNRHILLISMFFLCSLFGKVHAQDVLVAEYKFETDQQGWTWQAYTSLGGTTTNPSGGWISSVNWASPGFGGTAGCIRHNASTIQGSWYARSPGLTFTAGKQYYVKFGARLAGYTATTNQRVQVRIGTSTTPNAGAIVLGSTSIPSPGTTYAEYTSPNYNALTTATYYVALADFYSNGSGWACYFDGVRIYEVNSGGPTIITSAASPLTYCAGATGVSVPYTITGTFNAGNNFTAQLSDASGNFGTPTTIGTNSNSIIAGTISCTIPSGAGAGSLYRIRVVGDNPSTIGGNNGSNITINVIPACATSPTPATASSGASVTGSLSWTASAGATGYDVYFGTPAASLVSTNQAGTTYDPGLRLTNTTYQWYVIPKNSCVTQTSCSTSTIWSFTSAFPLFRTATSGNWNTLMSKIIEGTII
jgi:hypothetical protein